MMRDRHSLTSREILEDVRRRAKLEPFIIDCLSLCRRSNCATRTPCGTLSDGRSSFAVHQQAPWNIGTGRLLCSRMNSRDKNQELWTSMRASSELLENPAGHLCPGKKRRAELQTPHCDRH
jgi:hypothetical protein